MIRLALCQQFWLRLFVTSLLFVPLMAPVAAFARPETPELGMLAGRWQQAYEDAEGHNQEVWTFTWDESGTFLNYCTEFLINGERAFLGTGFAFFDAETGEYRLYLMMDNGALHESIGHRQADASLVFTTRTHGPVPFPDLRTEIRVTEAGLEVDYISRSEGETVRDQNLLVRVEDEE